jgi:gliding motility-associated-like protein
LLNADGNGTSFIWSPVTGLSNSSSQTVIASPTVQETYTVVASLNNCTNSAFGTVSVMPLPVPVIVNSTPVVCLNEDVTLEGQGGLGYYWQGPGGSDMGGGKILNFKASSLIYSGIYTLQVNDRNNCFNFKTTYVVVKPLPSGELVANKTEGCVPFRSDFVFSPLLSAGNPSVVKQTWELQRQDDRVEFTSTNDSFGYYFTRPGKFIVRGEITGDNACVNNGLTYTVNVFENPKADFKWSPERPIEGLEDVVFTDASTGADLNSFNWYFIDNKGFRSTNQNTSYFFKEAGTYLVAFVISDSRKCSDSIIKKVIIEPDFNFFIPNVFTPNGDGTNEIFIPVTRGVKFYSFTIFNRWGQKIFESRDATLGWDGSFSGSQCPEGVYTWKAVISTTNAEAKELNGHVTLYR